MEGTSGQHAVEVQGHGGIVSGQHALEVQGHGGVVSVAKVGGLKSIVDLLSM